MSSNPPSAKNSASFIVDTEMHLQVPWVWMRPISLQNGTNYSHDPHLDILVHISLQIQFYFRGRIYKAIRRLLVKDVCYAPIALKWLLYGTTIDAYGINVLDRQCANWGYNSHAGTGIFCQLVSAVSALHQRAQLYIQLMGPMLVLDSIVDSTINLI
jgi:hypothetical protein